MGNLSKLDPAIERSSSRSRCCPRRSRGCTRAPPARASPAPRKVSSTTPRNSSCSQDLVVRARVTDGGDDDSTVKLRPLTPPNIPPRWCTTDDVRVELDVVGRKQVPSAKLDGKPEQARSSRSRRDAQAEQVVHEAQEATWRRAADGTELNDLAVLGPVDARKWELPPTYFPHELSVEEWSLPDGTRFFELSFKVDRGQGCERGAGVRRAARLPEDRPQGRPEPQDAEGARVLRRAAALTHLAR